MLTKRKREMTLPNEVYRTCIVYTVYSLCTVCTMLTVHSMCGVCIVHAICAACTFCSVPILHTLYKVCTVQATEAELGQRFKVSRPPGHLYCVQSTILTVQSTV